MRRAIPLTLLIILMFQIVPFVHAWELERPGSLLLIGERTDNATTDGQACAGLGVSVYEYIKDPTDGADCVCLNVSMTASSRMGIAYSSSVNSLWWIDESLLYSRVDRPNVGDDVIFSVDIPQEEGGFIFRFYGGPSSAEYTRLYISVNGFLSVEDSCGPNPSPQSIPSVEKPNGLIAAVWSDLLVDSSASIITGIYMEFSHLYFVVTWKNVLHKASGTRLTFQIVLDNAPDYNPADTRYGQSRIRISYLNVRGINTPFTRGIEDQAGIKGVDGLFGGSQLALVNGATVWYCQNSNSYFLKKLTLTFHDTEPNSSFLIRNDPVSLRGYNVLWNSPQASNPDLLYTFLDALAGAFPLLIDVIYPPEGLIHGCAFIIGATTYSVENVVALAERQYSGRKVDIVDINLNPNLRQNASASIPTFDYVVDASLGIIVHWRMLDSCPYQQHSLTIGAIVDYVEYSPDGNTIPKQMSTGVNLEMGPDTNTDFSSASWLQSNVSLDRQYLGKYDSCDYYKINAMQGQWIDVSAQTRSGDPLDLALSLYDQYAPTEPPNYPPRTSTLPSYGLSESLSYKADYSGIWFIEVLPSGNDYGLYEITAAVHNDCSPNTPETPSSYSDPPLYHNMSYQFYTRTTDPEGSRVYCKFDWNDGTTTETGPTASGFRSSAWHTWTLPGTYYVKVCARDDYNDWGSYSKSLAVSIGNRYVNCPSKPSGCTLGSHGIAYTYSTSTTDPDGDYITYLFFWGDNKDTYVGPVASGLQASVSHTWALPGTYSVEVFAMDTCGSYGAFSPCLAVTMTNQLPNQPSQPSGKSSGYVCTSYPYTTNASDPDGDKVRFTFDWNDTTTEPTDLVDSGTNATVPHSWARPGTYQINVRAKDACGASANNPSPTLTVTITQNDAYSRGDASNTINNAWVYSPGSYFGTLYQANPTDNDDWYRFPAEEGIELSIHLSSPSNANFDLELYDPNDALRQFSRNPLGYGDYIDFIADVPGLWAVHVKRTSGEGQYSFFISEYAPGGCPVLFVNDGQQYRCEGLLNIHNPNGTDVVANCVLRDTPQQINGVYLFQLVEHPQTISHIDRVKLYAVLENGATVQLPLVYAWHSEYGNVLPQLLFSDDWRTETMGAIWNNGVSQSVQLKFLALPPNIKATAFIFKIEGYNIIAKR